MSTLLFSDSEGMPAHRVHPLADLADLAARIQAEHCEVLEAAESAIEHAIKAGNLLIEAKARVPHGGFEKWVEDNCLISLRQARKYGQVAKAASRGRFDLNKPESLNAALAMLGDPKPKPDPEESARRARNKEVLRIADECERTGEDIHKRMGFAQVEDSSGSKVDVPAVKFTVTDVIRPEEPDPGPETIRDVPAVRRRSDPAPIPSWDPRYCLGAYGSWTLLGEQIKDHAIRMDRYSDPEHEMYCDPKDRTPPSDVMEQLKRVVEWVRLYEPEPEPAVEPEPEPRKKPRLTDDQKARIVAMDAEGKERREIAEAIGCSQSTVSSVLKRNQFENGTWKRKRRRNLAAK